MTERRRLSPDERKAVILDAAAQVVEKNHGNLLAVTMKATANVCSVPTSEATIKYYFKTEKGLRQAVEANLK